MTQKIEQYYDENPEFEWNRLERHRLEFAITMRALEEYLPAPPAKILDVGGGPGRYAIALTQKGYLVTLVDLSYSNLGLAGRRADEAGVTLNQVIHANALDLSLVNTSDYDAVLLFGPLYHLLKLEDRRQAVRETCSKLKPGGLLFAVFLGRYAFLRWAAKDDPEWILRRQGDHQRVLDSGQYERPPDEPGFIDAYLEHPSEIEPFMASCGLQSLDLIGCEGAVSMIEDKINALTGELWDAWVSVNYRLSKDPSIHGAAEHLLYVGKTAASS